MSRDNVYRFILFVVYLVYIFAVCYSTMFQTFIVLLITIAVSTIAYKLIK